MEAKRIPVEVPPPPPPLIQLTMTLDEAKLLRRLVGSEIPRDACSRIRRRLPPREHTSEPCFECVRLIVLFNDVYNIVGKVIQ